MNLKSLKPKEVIKEEWCQEYEDQIEMIWSQIVRLNLNLFVLEKIIKFPFKLFFPLGVPFWELVYHSLFETNILIIWEIAIDNDKNILTIKRLKNEVIKNIKDQSLAYAFKKELKQKNIIIIKNSIWL